MFWVKIALKQKKNILCHDATHVIFGLDTSLEEEAMLDLDIFWWRLL